jgi:hypothetical protein
VARGSYLAEVRILRAIYREPGSFRGYLRRLPIKSAGELSTPCVHNWRESWHAAPESADIRGVPAEVIGELLSPIRFRAVDGEDDDFLPAFRDADPKFDPPRWFTDYPFCTGGRTWLLRRGWGTNTEPTLTALCEAFPRPRVREAAANRATTVRRPAAVVRPPRLTGQTLAYCLQRRVFVVFFPNRRRQGLFEPTVGSVDPGRVSRMSIREDQHCISSCKRATADHFEVWL